MEWNGMEWKKEIIRTKNRLAKQFSTVLEKSSLQYHNISIYQ